MASETAWGDQEGDCAGNTSDVKMQDSAAHAASNRDPEKKVDGRERSAEGDHQNQNQKFGKWGKPQVKMRTMLHELLGEPRIIVGEIHRHHQRCCEASSLSDAPQCFHQLSFQASSYTRDNVRFLAPQSLNSFLFITCVRVLHSFPCNNCHHL